MKNNECTSPQGAPSSRSSLAAYPFKAFRPAIHAIILTLMVSLLCCLHKSPIRRESIQVEIDSLGGLIERNQANLAQLRDKRIGDTGYFYVFNSEGTILYHPQPALTGMDFSGVPMVRRMLERKSGCMIQFLEGMEKLIVFRRAGDDKILCFTISAGEIEGPRGECEELR